MVAQISSTLEQESMIKDKLFVAAVADGRYFDVVDINNKPHYQVFNTQTSKCSLIPVDGQMGRIETVVQANQLGLEYEDLLEQLSEKDSKYLRKLMGKFEKVSKDTQNIVIKALEFAESKIREKDYFNDKEGNQEYVLGVMGSIKEKFVEIQKEQASETEEEKV